MQQDDLIGQFFPEGEERWIKVKYHNSNRASSVLRFDNPDLKYSKEQLGFEITVIGIREEYMPQVEALLELKKEVEFDTRFYDPAANPLNLFKDQIDNKIGQLLEKYTINN